MEQHAAIKFCYRLVKSAAVTYDLMRQTYENESFHRATIIRWHKAFSEGRASAASIPHGSRPKTSVTPVNVNTLAAVIQEDRHLSRRSLASLLNVPPTFINRILKNELKMKSIS